MVRPCCPSVRREIAERPPSSSEIDANQNSLGPQAGSTQSWEANQSHLKQLYKYPQLLRTLCAQIPGGGELRRR